MKTSCPSALWLAEDAPIDREAYLELAERLRPALLAKMRDEDLPLELADPLSMTYLPLAAWVTRQKPAGKPLILGINGAQGTGKSTLRAFLSLVLNDGLSCRTAGFSIDDIYKTRAERLRLAREVHPLLSTRGVPGTHDVELGLRTLRALISPNGGAVALPVFDKSMDDRRPPIEWPVIEGPLDVVVFEGWCVGARPQTEADLSEPINELERCEDKDGAWRRHVNRQLQGPYAELFGQLDRLIMLKAPNMNCVLEWRNLQEAKLAARSAAGGEVSRLMDPREIGRFIMHYERLTRHMQAELPARADLILALDSNHRFTSITIKH